MNLFDPIFEWEKPYLCTQDGLLPLEPALVLKVRPDGRRGLYLLDGIEDGAIRYKSAYDNDVQKIEGAEKNLLRWLGGDANGAPRLEPTAVDAIPLLEAIRAQDGRTLLACLRNDPIEADSADVPIVALPADTATDWTVSGFEHAASTAGLGVSFRDVVYAMSELGCQAEAGSEGVRIVNLDGRVLVMIERAPGPVLLFTLYLEAFAGAQEGTERFAVGPSQSSDLIVDRLRTLMANGTE
jgi:hypothetical protein